MLHRPRAAIGNKVVVEKLSAASATLTTQLYNSSVNVSVPGNGEALSSREILDTVQELLAATSFIDIHTHLFTPSLGKLGLWGIDELLTYHYLEAELFRSSSSTPEHY